MEKKTIGGLIAALRKANGMTQKELAERLNVSDKTISRWERDDGAPDLAVIPVLAEIFGVTCDELLRGERKSPENQTNAPGESTFTAKGEKQRQRLLSSTLSQYRSRTYIAMGISAVGIISALICNLAFLKAVLGFLIGAIFFAVSIVCQAIFVNRAFLSVEDAGLEPAELSGYRRKVIFLAQKSIALTVGFIGFAFPMILMDAYVGLGADSMMMFGVIGAAAFLLVYTIVLYFLNASLLKKGVYSLTEKETAVYRRNYKLKRTCAIVLVILLGVTLAAHQFSTAIWGPFTIMAGTTFEDYESFIAYMEQNVPYEYETASNGSIATPIPEEQIGSPIYYDEYGNEITEEEAFIRRLEDKNGNVVCEYMDYNKSVISVQYTPKDGTILPIMVFTQDDLAAARQTAAVRHVIFVAAYCMEALVVALAYFKRKAR